MNAEDIMTPTVISISSDTSLFEAAKVMRDNDVGSLIVMSDNNIAGIVTDRDIIVRGISEGLDPKSTPVQHCMTSGCVCARTDDSIEKLADLMEEKMVRRVLVVDQDNRLVGMVSIGDIAYRVHDQKLAGEVLEEVCSVRTTSSRT